MNNSMDLMIDLFALRVRSWGICGLYTCFRIGRFIVKRYEQKTGLLNTVLFTNHVPFAKYLPNFFSSEIFTGHLMICLWGWRYFKNKRAFKDKKDSEEIKKHFAEKEIKKVSRYALVVLVFLTHIIIYYTFLLVWPGTFS